MWTTVISFILSKLSIVKQYLTVILACVTFLAIVSALYYRYEYLQLQGQIDSVINVQEVKVEYIEKIIEKENIIYKDKIKYIKEYIYNDNKTKCENAISLIRSTNL